MSKIAIKVENLSKQYRLGDIGTGSLAHDINRWWHTIRGKDDPYLKIGETNDRTKSGGSEYVWSLRDIGFDIQQGDAVGIIGRNGAGKSTLLKVLSRVTAPTTGSIKVKGRIASLLEVGTGFHPDLTGRENIFLNGAILGMRKHEIKKHFDAIVDFAGVERYVDTPVKRYSSGMYVRLAFAVAAHLESEILIVDEVLAVGDAEFQKKCLGKMGEVSKGEGRTVLFVSHDMQAVLTLTQKCLFLENGKLNSYDQTPQIITHYIDSAKVKDLTYSGIAKDDSPTILSAFLKTSLSNNVHTNGDDLVVTIKINNPFTIRLGWLAIQITDSREKNYIHAWINNYDNDLFKKPGEFEVTCTLPKLKLYMGKYFFNFFISEPPGGRIFESVLNVCPFEVNMHNSPREFPWRENEAVYIQDNNWDIKRL